MTTLPSSSVLATRMVPVPSSQLSAMAGWSTFSMSYLARFSTVLHTGSPTELVHTDSTSQVSGSRVKSQ